MNLKAPPLMFRAATLIALALPSLPALAIEPFTADYQASYMGLQANGTMSVVAQGNNRWRYSLNIRNQVANLSQNTVFDEKDGRYRPLSGSDHSLMLIKKKNVDATYDWDKREATWSGDIKPDRAGPVSLQAGDMDGLLMNLALVRDVAAGKPLLAECGGMMSLFEEVVDKAGVAHRFGGLLPGRSVMQQRLAALGTQFVDLPEGRLAGHTFHYSKSDTSLAPLVLAKTSDGRDGEAVYRQERLTASYVHFYFPSNPEAIAALFG